METQEQRNKRYQDMFEYVDKIKVKLYGQHGEKLLKQYLATCRTPAELAADLKELAEYRRQIEAGELVRVVRCENCRLLDTTPCCGSYKTVRGWFTPRCLGGCLNGKRWENG